MSQLPADFLMGDLDALICAVAARLRALANEAEDPVSAGVLECVAARMPPISRLPTRAPGPARAG